MTTKEMVNHANGRYELLHKLEDEHDAIDWSALAGAVSEAGLTVLFVQHDSGEKTPYLAWYSEE